MRLTIRPIVRLTGSKVAEIVNSPEAMKSWGVDEPGVFICCDATSDELSCDVFQNEAEFYNEGIAKLSEQELQEKIENSN